MGLENDLQCLMQGPLVFTRCGCSLDPVSGISYIVIYDCFAYEKNGDVLSLPNLLPPSVKFLCC